jgi:hypothetical protein
MSFIYLTHSPYNLAEHEDFPYQLVSHESSEALLYIDTILK